MFDGRAGQEQAPRARYTYPHNGRRLSVLRGGDAPDSVANVVGN
jgi:hypothetical protein